MDSRLIPFRNAVHRFDFDVRYVGGCVRDTLAGLRPKDVDLATDMTPQDQERVYKALGLRYIPTGARFGTFTVVIEDMPYEITSLRTESEHDGRHATMTFTRDWISDLGRRDLTINAMAMTFDGELIDPFGGESDLRDGRVRFVGSAQARIEEDYLRILRWFRFHGRFGKGALDPATCEAVARCAPGLTGISTERVWSEIAKIVCGPQGAFLMAEMARLGVSTPILLPTSDAGLERLRGCRAMTPVARMVALVSGEQAIVDLAADWRWSAAERDLGVYLARNFAAIDLDLKREIAVAGVSLDFVTELARLQGREETEIDALAAWSVPSFPVGGKDLMDVGFKPGPDMGRVLRDLRDLWATSGYKLSRQALLDAATM